MEFPVRTCLAGRARRGKPQLLRLVASAGVAVVAPTAQRSGRGARVGATNARSMQRLRRGAIPIARALRMDGNGVSVDEDGLRTVVCERTAA